VAGIVTLLTDFGWTDYYVGAVKGTLLRLAPRAKVVDLSHDVPPGDVEGAADLIAGACPAFPEGTVHLAVVDPGVGSDRRMLVVTAGSHHFVAPDNGLLTPFLDEGRAWAVTRTDLFLDAPGATFHGRDRFAPIAAALVRGNHPAALGEPIADAVRLVRPAPRREQLAGGAARLHGRIVRVDRFGNLITDLPAEWLGTARPLVLDAEVSGRRAERLVGHYAELGLGEPGLLVGSLGTLELSLRGASLASAWGVARGTAVTVELRPA
jgi:S-adenosylmethionine hydrolase